MRKQRNTKPGRAPGRFDTNFDRVARIYRWAEYLLLGRLLTRAREHYLRDLQHARHALVLGDGDGRFLATLLRSTPTMRALAIDTSARMLLLLAGRCRFAGSRLTTRQASAIALPPDLDLGHADLIATHFFLDCLTQAEVDGLAATLAGTVRPACLWVVSDFGIPSRQPWRTLGRWYVGALYLAFRLLTGLRVQRLPDIETSLSAAGFRRIHHRQWLKGLLYAQLWHLGTSRPPAKPGDGATSARPEPSTIG